MPGGARVDIGRKAHPCWSFQRPLPVALPSPWLPHILQVSRCPMPLEGLLVTTEKGKEGLQGVARS